MESAIVDVEYEQGDGGVCETRHAWARVPPEPSRDEREALKDKIRRLLRERDAVMVSHYYVAPRPAGPGRGNRRLVSDSLEMARFGRDHAASTLVVAGVRFMGETREDPVAGKARADARSGGHVFARSRLSGRRIRALLRRSIPIAPWSSMPTPRCRESAGRLDGDLELCAGRSCAHLHAQGEKILWAPDKHLGHYIQRQTGADMLMLERRVRRARRVQGAGAGSAEEGTIRMPRCWCIRKARPR